MAIRAGGKEGAQDAGKAAPVSKKRRRFETRRFWRSALQSSKPSPSRIRGTHFSTRASRALGCFAWER
jgi:hypothetical protein